MADDVMALEERLARLEMTVASGFSETGALIKRIDSRLGDVEGRLGDVESGLRGEIGSLESRLRVLIEASRDEQRTMAEAFGFTLDRIEARLERMHQEHRQAHGDYGRVMQDHERRLTALERHQKDPRSGR